MKKLVLTVYNGANVVVKPSHEIELVDIIKQIVGCLAERLAESIRGKCQRPALAG